ncbi:HAD family hydrolase [Celeribacter indicus]|uniref:Putative hydrolase phosphatase protein n=1 Tax=Celeribacter indicus TaxID=1208324 RepID=A0A0B5E453_9RHOB|nr:HAD-IA family hydrolase [Celeribacter indicus]AJE47836.1 putative hydrolase phosphatase protein [Celeribacter indicus]SDW24450.1 haloacid dehalogenase superfamily, subfamily IA, variant 3 with third motif having DD or ED [Celeribacter indicus]
MTDLICFDCDGVLVDSEVLATRTTVDCLAELGIALSPAEAAALFTGKSAEAAHRALRDACGIALPATYQARFDRLLFRRFREELTPVPGIAELLARLHLPSCVTSNSGHARLALALRLTGLAGHFGSRVFSAADVAHGKPAPDLFHFAAGRLGADPRRCLVIDDSVSGIAGAVAAGARAIGFTGGSHSGPDHAARLRDAGAARVVGSAQELTALLRVEAA